MPQLSEQVALITGAGRDPARKLALALAARGVGLALSDLTPMALEQSAGQARSLGARVSTHVTDPSKGLAARMLVDEVLETWDGLDILVLHPRAEPRQPLLQLDEWDFQRTVESNLNGPFLLMQLAANWMHSEARSGVIINLIGVGPTPPLAPEKAAFYASQMALRALTQTAAPELAALGVRLFGITCAETNQDLLARAAALAVRLCDTDLTSTPGTIFDFIDAEGEA
jgi:NAD(P)-dependent dehydrogenase (short-subunit alcohol dehydrogenase family)